MIEEFIKEEEAVDLYRIGYRGDTFAWYNFGRIEIFGHDMILDGYAGECPERPFAPTYENAFRWLVKEFGYEFEICVERGLWRNSGFFFEATLKSMKFADVSLGQFENRKDAEQALLRKAIAIAGKSFGL